MNNNYMKIFFIIIIPILLILLARMNLKNEDLQEENEKLHKRQIEMLKTLNDVIDTNEKLLKSNEKLLKINKEILEDNMNLLKLVENLEKEKVKSPSRNIISRNVPRNNSKKTYMDYRAIKDKTSKQYELQQNNACYTSNTGLRMIDEYYCIAVGTYYGKNIGDKLIIHMENGESFKAIVSDFKDDNDTDSTNRQHESDGSVIEFLVETDKLPLIVKKMGDISYLNNEFKGEIKSIEKED